MTLLNPYLSFQGDAREAMEFYRDVLGGDLTVTTFGEYAMGGPESADLVMHAQLTTPDGMTLMGSDTPPGMEYHAPAGVTVSLSGDDAERLQALWDGLSEGGTVTLPYEVPPWGGRFGQFTDRFGVDWMINSES